MLYSTYLSKHKKDKKIKNKFRIVKKILVVSIIFTFTLIVILSLVINKTSLFFFELPNLTLLRTNLERSKKGCPILKYNKELEIAANERAKSINNDLKISHQGWDYTVRKYYIYKAAGENFTVGYITENYALSAMIASDTHRKNILNCKFNDIGIGKSGKVIVILYGFAK